MEESGDYFGEPVIQAARLCAKALGGQILVPDVVRVLAPRGRHEFAAIGELELKGLPEPVAALEVVWHPVEVEAPEVVPLPDRLAVAYATRFVGRDGERDLLRDARKAAAAGERRVVLVSGEAGLGKTRLSTELARDAFDVGALVLYGRCDEELKSPYRPWVEALGHYVTHVSDDGLARHDPASLSELAKLVPALRPRVEMVTASSPAGDGDQYVLFAAVTALLRTLAVEEPVVIVLDDLHWADHASLQLLRHVVGEISAAPILIVATYRDTDISVDDPLTAVLAALHRETGVERLALVGLSDNDIISLLEATAGHDMDADGVQLAHALRMETGGNPFFVGELLLHLAESGSIAQQDDGRWVATVDLDAAGLPQSVREVVGARVRRLGEDAHRVLGAAAVVGRDFDVAVVAGAVDLDDDAVLDILEPAMTAGLVAEVPGASDRFTFTHALVQHTLYEDLAISRRARLHRKIAETIEALAGEDAHDRVGELATHWFAATRPAEIDKAIGYAIRAGDQALSALGPDEAVGWYRQALDATDDHDDQQRCGVMVRLGEAERQAGHANFRERLLDAARLAQQLGDNDLLVKAALANHRGSEASAGEVDTERVEVLAAALDTPDATDATTRARLLATLAVELTYSGDLERITTLADEAVALARQLGDPATLVQTLNAHHLALRLPETLARRLDTTREAVALAAGLGDPWRQFSAHRQRLQAAVESGDRAERNASIAACHEIATRVRQPFLRWVDTQNRALQALLDGDPDQAESLADEAFAIGTESGQPDALTLYGIQLLDLRDQQGRAAEIVDLLAEGIEDNPGLPALRAGVARAYLDADRPDEAKALLDAGVDLPRDENWLIGTSMWAHVAARLGAFDTAAVLIDRLAPWAGQIPTAGVVAQEPLDHWLGELAALIGRVTEADAHFAAAEATARAFGSPFYIARTLLERARLDAEHDQDTVQARVSEALTIAIDHGYARLQRDAAGVLATG